MSICKTFDPIADHYNYTAVLERESHMRDAVLDEMYNLRQDAVERIDYIVHPSYAKEFTKLLAYGFNEGLPEAERICDKIGLTQEHFVALDGDEKEMRKILEQKVYDMVPDSAYDYEFDKYVEYDI